MKKPDALKAAISVVDAFAVCAMNPDDYVEFERLTGSLLQHYINCEGKAEKNIRLDERQKCWDEINAEIKHGPIPGTGHDEAAQRNGLVMATNILMRGLSR